MKQLLGALLLEAPPAAPIFEVEVEESAISPAAAAAPAPAVIL